MSSQRRAPVSSRRVPLPALPALPALLALAAVHAAAQCPGGLELDLCPSTTLAPTTTTATAAGTTRAPTTTTNIAVGVAATGAGRPGLALTLLAAWLTARPGLATAGPAAWLLLALGPLSVAGLPAAPGTCGEARDFYRDQGCCGKPQQALAGPTPAWACAATGGTGVCDCEAARALVSSVPGVALPVDFCDHLAQVKPVGWHAFPICEAGDAGNRSEWLVDGRPGNIAFPHGDIKVLATAGEVDGATGAMLTGVPDGMGAYLLDAATVRVIYQSEAYGQLEVDEFPSSESFPFRVEGGATFTGSHIHFIDVDREALAAYMQPGAPSSAEHMVRRAGEAVRRVYNLRRELVGRRNRTGATLVAAHDSNVNLAGEYIVAKGGKPASPPSKADWLLQSLCNAHLEERLQWSDGQGVQDRLFITNEEWMNYARGSQGVIGLPVHVLNLATGELWATAAFTLAGHEKVVEVNTGTRDFVAFVPSGYNGQFGDVEGDGVTLAQRNALYNRTDGQLYVWPRNIVPTRLYIGKKSTDKDGRTNSTDFLARNGFEFGALYGFAVNCSEVAVRDTWHATAGAGDSVQGAFYKLRWQAERGTVRGFEHDGAWEFQDAPAGAPAGWCWWTGRGPNQQGKKTEHVTPDPRGGLRVMQGSTAGYFGVYNFSSLTGLLQGGALPQSIPATYTALQPATDADSLIRLGGQGLRSDGSYATVNTDSSGTTYRRFKDVDGLEWIAAANSTDYVVMFEDSGNIYGDRAFLARWASPMQYYFIAQSGGRENSRIRARVSSVAGVMAGAAGAVSGLLDTAQEFSGTFDLSGLLRKGDGAFRLSSDDATGMKRRLEAETPINNKSMLMGLQSHTLRGGFARTFNPDRISQVLVYQPRVPAA